MRVGFVVSTFRSSKVHAANSPPDCGHRSRLSPAKTVPAFPESLGPLGFDDHRLPSTHALALIAWFHDGVPTPHAPLSPFAQNVPTTRTRRLPAKSATAVFCCMRTVLCFTVAR